MLPFMRPQLTKKGQLRSSETCIRTSQNVHAEHVAITTHVQHGQQQKPPATLYGCSHMVATSTSHESAHVCNEASLQASIQAQQSMLTQLCSSINRLAATSTEATKATTNLAENSSAAAAAAATAATQAQLQQAQAASGLSSRGLPGPLSRAAAECVVSNAGYVSTLLLKGAAKVAAEADVVAAILCHKVLLSEYVPPRAAAGGRRAEFLNLRCGSLPRRCACLSPGVCQLAACTHVTWW